MTKINFAQFHTKDAANEEARSLNERARLRRTTVDRLDDLSISISKKMGTAIGRSDNPFLEWERGFEQTNEAFKFGRLNNAHAQMLWQHVLLNYPQWKPELSYSSDKSDFNCLGF